MTALAATPKPHGNPILLVSHLVRMMPCFSISPNADTFPLKKMQLIYTTVVNMALALVEVRMNYVQPCNHLMVKVTVDPMLINQVMVSRLMGLAKICSQTKKTSNLQ